MRLLFDTHTFLWWHGERAKLSAKVLELCEAPENTVFLSLASVWEIQIKHHLDKLKLARPLADVIKLERQENHIELLPISLTHLLSLYNLPHHHRDPFDRLLVAQALVEDAAIISHDPEIGKYPAPVIW